MVAGIDWPFTVDKTVTLKPTPKGYARSLYTIIQNSDAKGKAWALEEMERLFSALWKDDFDEKTGKWKDEE